MDAHEEFDFTDDPDEGKVMPMRRRTSAGGPNGKFHASNAQVNAAQDGLASDEPGETEAAVRAECESLGVSKSQPAMVANAVKMARILDQDELVALHPTTSRQLTTILGKLQAASPGAGQGGAGGTSRLAEMQAMAQRSE